MRNEYVPRVGRVSPKRLLSAIEVADEAFWVALVEELPEVETGDFPPLGLSELEEIRNKTVISFVELNHDSHLSPYELKALGYDESAKVNVNDLSQGQHMILQAWREENCV